jgi:hypothetical protein
MPLYDFRSVCLPYCLELQSCGRYAILNREYKPLGWHIQQYIRYEQYPILLTLRVTPLRAKNLSCYLKADTRKIYLYHDGCIPTANSEVWSAYSARLEYLAKITIDKEIGSFGVCVRNLKDADKLEKRSRDNGAL